jgi:sn-glycerol 3-phosphate transport system substrate-binding protein
MESWMSARGALAAAALLLILTGRAAAAVEIQWWHAMQGERGRQLEKLAASFNETQPEYQIVPVYKGNYSETLAAAIVALRSRQQPAIVQVVEVATATMMAAKGAIYPVYELMRDQGEEFEPGAYLPAITSYYTDLSGNMLSFPFNSSTPILYYNKDQFRAVGLNPDQPPKTWPDVEAAARRLVDAGVRCGFSTEWPSWIHVENFSAYHNLPLATKTNGFGGLDTELVFNNPAVVKHIAMLVEWQKAKIFDYGGRGNRAESKFHSSECAMYLGSSGTRTNILANGKFDLGYGMMPYWPDVISSPQNSIIGGATLWVLKGRSDAEYQGVARFFAHLSRPGLQAWWHQNTGYMPITRKAYELSRAQGFYDRNPGSDIAVEQLTLNPPSENSRGFRLGSFLLIRDIIEDELEQAFFGRKSAKAALDAAVRRGNDLLRQFERANQ